MNATLKAKRLLHKFEAEGWSLGLQWCSAGYYVLTYGGHPNNTVRTSRTLIATHKNGKVRRTDTVSPMTGFSGDDWEATGLFAYSLEGYIAAVLAAYGRALPGSRAARDNMLAPYRLTTN